MFFPCMVMWGPVQVKVEVKDNQTTNTKVTAIMRDVGPQNYGEFNEPLFCNEAVLWAVDKKWMGTSGLQKCLNVMDGMVEDSSRD